jgi:hypothetical protein
MAIIDHSADQDRQSAPPLAPNPLEQYQVGIVTLGPGQRLWAAARRAALRGYEGLGRFALVVVSGWLRLSWRQIPTVSVDAEVVADDRASAEELLVRFLRDPATRVVLAVPDRGPTGWRVVGGAPVDRVGAVVAVPDGFDCGSGDRSIVWQVTASVTATIAVAARDAVFLGRYCYGDLEPYLPPEPIGRLIAGHTDIRRTVVRHRRGR